MCWFRKMTVVSCLLGSTDSPAMDAWLGLQNHKIFPIEEALTPITPSWLPLRRKCYYCTVGDIVPGQLFLLFTGFIAREIFFITLFLQQLTQQLFILLSVSSQGRGFHINSSSVPPRPVSKVYGIFSNGIFWNVLGGNPDIYWK